MNYGSAEAEVLASILVLGMGHCWAGIVICESSSCLSVSWHSVTEGLRKSAVNVITLYLSRS